VHRNLIGQ